MPTKASARKGEQKQRRQGRINLPVDTGVYVTSPNGEWIGRVRNLSEGGMFVDSVTPASPGSVLRLRLSAQGGQTFDLACIVRFVIASGAGMEFVEAPPALLRQIRILKTTIIESDGSRNTCK